MLDKKDVLLRHILEIIPVPTSHGIGEKRVIATQVDTGKPITQIARTRLKVGEEVEAHVHQTMDEHFFILNGECEIITDNIRHHCKADDYLYIPANCSHSIYVVTDTIMITIGIETCSKNILG